MDFTSEIDRTPADLIAVEAVRALESIDLGTPAEYFIRNLVRVAAGDANLIAEAKSVSWLSDLEVSGDHEYITRTYSKGRPMAAGSRQRVIRLLNEAERRLV